MVTTSAPTLDQAAVDAFRQTLRGSLYRPGDEGFDQARRVHNGMHDRRPALVVCCAGVSDVIASVKFARGHNLPAAIKGGGHSVPGYSSIKDGILIDLSSMRGVRVDPEARTARAEAGCLWADLDHETQAFGLAVTGGQVSHTGIAGLTLGGGFGYLVRKYGFTVDSLISVDLVTADGTLLHASESENPDLYWGVRGGGGNFGIVTSFEYRLHPVGPIVIGGMLLFPASEAAALLGYWRDYMPSAPEELTMQFAFITAPPAQFIPEPVRGTKLIGLLVCFLGSPEEADRVLAPIKEFRTPAVDLVGPIPYTILQTLINDGVPHGLNYYTKGHFLREISDDAIEAIVSTALVAPSPMSVVGIFSLGGAAGRVPEDATAMGSRDALYSLDIIGVWPDSSQTEENVEWVGSVWEAARPYGTGRSYVNLQGDASEASVDAAYGTGAQRRLAQIKAKYDPDNFFNRNANIKPAR